MIDAELNRAANQRREPICEHRSQATRQGSGGVAAPLSPLRRPTGRYFGSPARAGPADHRCHAPRQPDYGSNKMTVVSVHGHAHGLGVLPL
jgi:hypothetical protein